MDVLELEAPLNSKTLPLEKLIIVPVINLW